MMNKYRITFSPTGGTEKVLKSITKNWGTCRRHRSYNCR